MDDEKESIEYAKQDITERIERIQKSFKYTTKRDTFDVVFVGMRKPYGKDERLPHFEIQYSSKQLLARRRYLLDDLICTFCQSCERPYVGYMVDRRVYMGEISFFGIKVFGEEETNINPHGYDTPKYFGDKILDWLDDKLTKLCRGC
jgi:hypothetical protein